MPVKWHGIRMDPPTSPPIPIMEPSAAKRAASPPDDPPQVRARSLGELVVPGKLPY